MMAAMIREASAMVVLPLVILGLVLPGCARAEKPGGAEEPTAEAETPKKPPRGTIDFVVDGDPAIRLGPHDVIPAIDAPEMIPASAAGAMLDEEPVLGVFDGRQARAYPTWVLDGHEVVNDRLSETPIAATW